MKRLNVGINISKGTEYQKWYTYIIYKLILISYNFFGGDFMRKHLTLTYNLITKQQQYSNWNLYIFLNYLRRYLDYMHCSVDKDYGLGLTVVNQLQPVENINQFCASIGLSRSTWYDSHSSKLFPTKTWLINDEPAVAFLPLHTFDKVMGFLDTMAQKSREPYLRLYCYVFFQDAYYRHEFQGSQEQMAIDLGMSRPWLNRALQRLVDAGLIVRDGKYKFTGEQTFARKHSIPDDDRCKEYIVE